jgi:hypothetical protein
MTIHIKDQNFYPSPADINYSGLVSETKINRHVDWFTGAPLVDPASLGLFRRPVAQQTDEYDLDADGQQIWRGPLYPDMPRLNAFRAKDRAGKLTPGEASLLRASDRARN